MNPFIWMKSVNLWFLWIIPVLAVFFVFRFIKIKHGEKQFWGLSKKFQYKQLIQSISLLIIVVMLVITLAAPAKRMKTINKFSGGNDTLFVIDVSKSMLAEDIRPNRLQQAIVSIADGFKALKNNRVGLMVYAGTAVVKCPLTYDYGFFMETLQYINTKSVSRGGSMSGDAFRKIKDQILWFNSGRTLEIILITDGDDQDSLAEEAAAELAAYDVSILGIIIGDDRTGARIPVINESGEKEFLMFNNMEVWSVANPEKIESLVKYIPKSATVQVTKGMFDFSNIYKGFKTKTSTEIIEKENYDYIELFQLFMILLILFLLVHFVFTLKIRRNR